MHQIIEDEFVFFAFMYLYDSVMTQTKHYQSKKWGFKNGHHCEQMRLFNRHLKTKKGSFMFY